MKLRIFIEPQQGADFATQARVAHATEELGFDAFFRSDHFLAMGQPGLPGPTDSWVTLGALALQTSRIRLGTMVTAATFRLPGPLAIAVAQVDQMSGGRVDFGLGTGWFEAEHTAYGIPFPSLGERFDRFEEQLAVITGLWETPEGQTFSYAGTHYQLTDSPALPKPAQRPRPPVIVGGGGPRRTPRLAAQYADEFNSGFRDLAETEAQFGRVRDACTAAGRDPATLEITAGVPLVYPELGPAAMANSLSGTPAHVAETLQGFADVGVGHVIVDFAPHTPAALDLFAQAVQLFRASR